MTKEERKLAEEALGWAKEQTEDVPREWEETEKGWERRQRRLSEGLAVLGRLLAE